MDKQIMTLKECSASTDVEAATEPLHKTKRVLQDSEMSVKLKKHKQESDEVEKTTLRKEIEEIAKSLKDMSQCLKILQENSLTKDDLELILLKMKETPEKEVEEMHDCCFETKDAKGNNENTIFVFGFSCSGTRDDVRCALKNHFGSCGEITRVFVPIECKTGAPLGFAFINLRKEPKKALTQHGSYLGGLKLTVTMAKSSNENYSFTYFDGCERCPYNFRKARHDDFIATHGGRVLPRNPYFHQESPS